MREEVTECLLKVEQSGNCRNMLCTIVFLDTEKCHEQETYRASAHDGKMVGTLEGAGSRGTERKASSQVGCHRRPKWRSTAHGMGDLAGDGKVRLHTP